MHYIVTQLVTENDSSEFSLLGVTEDKARAAEIAAKAYGAYNKKASFQGVELIAEWLRTKLRHSFRRDKDHRLQLAITPVDGETPEGGSAVIFSAAKEQEARLHAQVEQKEEENNSLKDALSHANDPDYILGLARDRLGLVEDGERVFRDVNN